jgi:metal-dependent HD superfamily phosphatase/phosphodiesterase
LINALDNEKISFASKQSKKEKEFRDFYETANKCYEKKTYLEYYNCNKEGYKKYNDYVQKYNEINESE